MSSSESLKSERLCKEGSVCLSYPHATGLHPWWGSLTPTPTQQQSKKPLSTARCPLADMLNNQRKAIIILQLGQMGSSTCPKALTQGVQSEAVESAEIIQLIELCSRGLLL